MPEMSHEDVGGVLVGEGPDLLAHVVELGLDLAVEASRLLKSSWLGVLLRSGDPTLFRGGGGALGCTGRGAIG
jgi:hypothetical protein